MRSRSKKDKKLLYRIGLEIRKRRKNYCKSVYRSKMILVIYLVKVVVIKIIIINKNERRHLKVIIYESINIIIIMYINV